MTTHWGRRIVYVVAGAGLLAGVVGAAPAALAQGCPAGHINNRYTG
jgi:hypothetical protein